MQPNYPPTSLPLRCEFTRKISLCSGHYFLGKRKSKKTTSSRLTRLCDEKVQTSAGLDFYRGEWRNILSCNNRYLDVAHTQKLGRLLTLAARSAAVSTRLLVSVQSSRSFCASLGLLAQGNVVTFSACPERDVSSTAFCESCSRRLHYCCCYI